MAFHRYVALGDSFTEGVGDPDPTRPNGLRGWADRVALNPARVPPEHPGSPALDAAREGLARWTGPGLARLAVLGGIDAPGSVA